MENSPIMRVLAANIDHPEGVAWDPTLERVVFGTEGGSLLALSLSDGTISLLGETGGFLLGVVLDGAGAIYACDMTNGCVHRWDPMTGHLRRFSKESKDDPMRVPNFAVVGSRGHLWVSDSGSCWDAKDGTIWLIDRGGNATRATNEQLAFPNGMAVSPDGSFLLCLETFPPRLVKFPILSSGYLGPLQEIAQLPGTVPDGLVVTSTGDLLIACYRPDQILWLEGPLWRKKRVWVRDERGRLLAGSANLCFFGEGMDRLAVTNVGGNHVTEVVSSFIGKPLSLVELVSKE